jgi:tetratricopeptide (TPR) repeat protein
LERSGQRDEALALMKNAVVLAEALTNDEPRDLSYQMNAGLQNSLLAHLLSRLGETKESIGSFHRAVDRYERLLVADPGQKQALADLAYARGGLARALAQSKELEKAAAEIKQAVSFYSALDLAKTSNVSLLHDCAETLAAAARICLLNGGDVAEAKRLFERSLGIWSLMRDRATLSKADTTKPVEIAQALAQCDSRTSGDLF